MNAVCGDWRGLADAFDSVVLRRLAIQGRSYDSLEDAVGFNLEQGLSMDEFFRISNELGYLPVLMLIEVIAEYHRCDDYTSGHTSRRTEHASLFRLGYTHKVNDFRELGRVYESAGHALSTAQLLNEQRKQRGVALLDTISAYVRVGYHTISSGDQPGPST